jgi:hypothetical protein
LGACENAGKVLKMIANTLTQHVILGLTELLLIGAIRKH